MADGFTIEVNGLAELQARFDAMPEDVRVRLQGAMQDIGQLVEDAALARMDGLFASAGGRMRDAVSWHTESTDGIEAAIITASGLPYLAIQEFGGVTSPHDIFPVNAQCLAFMSPASLGFSSGATANGMVFTRGVHHPGSKMPERSYMRAGLWDSRGDIINILSAAVASGTQAGAA